MRFTRYRHGTILLCGKGYRNMGYTKPAGGSSWAFPPAMVINRVPTRCPCSSEWVIHTIALTVFSGLRSVDKVYSSTASAVSESRADVGSRGPAKKAAENRRRPDQRECIVSVINGRDKARVESSDTRLAWKGKGNNENQGGTHRLGAALQLCQEPHR